MIVLQKEMKLEYPKTNIIIFYNLNVQQITDNLSQRFYLKGKPNDIHAQNVLSIKIKTTNETIHNTLKRAFHERTA